jgi:Family of unknown function (DUF5670)
MRRLLASPTEHRFHEEQKKGVFMLFALGGLVLVIWLATLALKVTFGAIHLLLVLAVVLFVIGFIRGRTGRTPA